MVVVVNIAIISSERAYSEKLVATVPQIDLQAQFLRKQTQGIHHWSSRITAAS
jgi:hypothetical protein